MNRTMILHVGLYGCETRSLTLREEHRLSVLDGNTRCHRLRVFEHRVLWRIIGCKRDEVTGGRGENCIMRNFTIFYPSTDIIRVIILKRIKRAGMWHVLGGEKINTGF